MNSKKLWTKYAARVALNVIVAIVIMARIEKFLGAWLGCNLNEKIGKNSKKNKRIIYDHILPQKRS